MSDERGEQGVPFDWCERVEAVLDEFDGNDMAMACEIQRLREQNERLRTDPTDSPRGNGSDTWSEPVGNREAALARRVYSRADAVEDPHALRKAIEAVLRVRRERGDPAKTCDYCHFHRHLHYPHPETGEPNCEPDFGPNYFTPMEALNE